MSDHSRIRLTDGSFIARPHETAKWEAIAAPGKSIPNSMAASAAEAQNKAQADWMTKSVEERQNRIIKKPYVRDEK